MKKKQILLCLVCVLLLSLIGCGAKQEDAVPIEKSVADEETIEEVQEEEEEPEEEEPEQEEEEEPEQEKEEEPEEEDKPLDVEANEKLEYVMRILAGIGKNGDKYDFDLTVFNDVYSGEQYAVSSFMTYVNHLLPEPDKGYSEEDESLAQYSAQQAQKVMYSLTGTQTDISQAEKNGIVEVDLLWGDGFYIECEDWNAEYVGNNTWIVSCQICDIERYNYKMGKVTYTVIENPDSIFDGYSITDMQAAPASHAEWAQSYFDYLYASRTEFGYDHAEYRFIYLDDDDIPEIYVAGPDSASGNRLIYYSPEGVMEEWDASEYIERSGLMLCSNGRYGNGYDIVYQLVNGELQSIASGGYFDADIEYWSGAENMESSFNWNDEDVSREEYNRRLNEVFDKASALPCDPRYHTEIETEVEFESLSSILSKLSSL